MNFVIPDGLWKAIENFQGIRLIEAATKSFQSVTDSLSKQPELCFVLASGSVVGMAAYVFYKLPKLDKPVKRLATTPEDVILAADEYEVALCQYTEAILYRNIAFKAIVVMSGVVVVGSIYLAVKISNRVTFHQEAIDAVAAEQQHTLSALAEVQAEYDKELARVIAAREVPMSEVVENVIRKLKETSNPSCTSVVFVYNNTTKTVSVSADHPWKFSFNGTDHARIPPGGVSVLKGNMFTNLAAEGVRVKTDDGDWYRAKHHQIVPISDLHKTIKDAVKDLPVPV